MDILSIKNRFGIVGNHPLLNRAIEVAIEVAPTDLTILIIGESGTGKEIFPHIIHSFSKRKHNTFIAVNCGAIPEGTIESELFGHEKGSFTGAIEKRKGYFEVANNGTIFLDEISEMPLSTQAKLLRVLETGEFYKVGSSVPQKTNVRVVAATNVDLLQAVKSNKFREDLYYRISTIPIYLPPLRDRGEDILLLAKKFALDFAEKYKMPPIRFTNDAQEMLLKYNWPGNVRQLKNIIEQISIIEKKREIDSETLKNYLPNYLDSKLPVLVTSNEYIDYKTFNTEREILFKILFDMKNDISNLKAKIKELNDLIESQKSISKPHFIPLNDKIQETIIIDEPIKTINKQEEQEKQEKDEILSLEEKEKELIIRALKKHNGKRKLAAADLGISERTLYRKIKQYNLNL